MIPGAGTALVAGCGALTGLGLTVLLATWRRAAGSGTTPAASGTTPDRPDGTPDAPGTRTGSRPRTWARALLERLRRDSTTGPLPRQAAAMVAAVVIVGLLTRWPVAAVLAGAGAWAAPHVWRPDAATHHDSDRLEAIAVWTEMLRDTLSAAAGLEQAVLATVAATPDALAEPVAVLAGRLRDGERLPDALRDFADDVDDPTMDLVVAALVLAVTRQARDLTGLLSSLAQAARDQVVLRLRITTGRARVRTSVRIILLTTLGMMIALIMLNRGYLTVYDSPTGQLVLLLVGGLFATAFVWLDRIAAVPTPPRVLRIPAPDGKAGLRSGERPAGADR
jgi:tight adherence protein B